MVNKILFFKKFTDFNYFALFVIFDGLFAVNFFYWLTKEEVFNRLYIFYIIICYSELSTGWTEFNDYFFHSWCFPYFFSFIRGLAIGFRKKIIIITYKFSVNKCTRNRRIISRQPISVFFFLLESVYFKDRLIKVWLH